MTQESATGETRWSAVRASVAAFRAQIDKTGLFPDLKGEAGRALRKSVREDGQLTKSYMLMCGLSAGIAALGLLQSSTAVVIGAMLISPLMGPIASMGFGFASLDGRQIRDSVKVIAMGAAIGILTGILLTWLSPIRNATPEIIARTEPTLLDLAVAVLSGIAGAYATVQQKGATAIGVAIATALMPPLATVGYGLGVANMSFAFGAFLLFLTNLAAIAFSFALIARLSGAARPIAKVEITPRYVLAGLAAFAVLAIPLGVTLYRVTAEAKAQTTVRRLLAQELKLKPVNIAQLQVRWPLRGSPSVDAVIVAPRYANDAEDRLMRALEAEWGERPSLNLQQVVAADLQAQTRAIVDAAVETSAAGIVRDVPPLTAIREAIGLPTQALWTNRAERTVQIVPFAAEGWGFGDYREIEKAAAQAGGGWSVRVIPPVQPRITVPVALKDGAPQPGAALDDAVWAIERWGVQGLNVAGFAGANASDADRETAAALSRYAVETLAKAGIKANATPPAPTQRPRTAASGVEFEVVRQPKRAAAAVVAAE
ncbi:DUF389 domain-containing protein [Sphingomonas colocasiae]|uniref:DUF389 domain-containing protein n=1 Tax=Sphingomonas colocasiae TaxID=1848973 RepID=UPI001FE6DFDC|nr:DUF389 domain-containing protein [Sphingomonas colocasiae]